VGDDDAALHRYLAIFRRMAATMIDDLSAAVGARDGDASGRLAHKLKGSAGGVGADEVAALSHAAEVGRRSEAWHDVECSLAGLAPAFVRLEEAITAVRA